MNFFTARTCGRIGRAFWSAAPVDPHILRSQLLCAPVDSERPMRPGHSRQPAVPKLIQGDTGAKVALTPCSPAPFNRLATAVMMIDDGGDEVVGIASAPPLAGPAVRHHGP